MFFHHNLRAKPTTMPTQCKRKIAAAINISSRNNHTGDNIVQKRKTPGIRNKLAGKKADTRDLCIYTRAKKEFFF